MEFNPSGESAAVLLLQRMIFFSLLFATVSLAYIDEGSLPLVQISSYKPIYFVAGKGGAKLQLSFKARPAEAVPLYFGYSQLMIWEIFSTSLCKVRKRAARALEFLATFSRRKSKRLMGP